MTRRKDGPQSSAKGPRKPVEEGAAAPLPAGRKRALYVGPEARKAKGVAMLISGARHAEIAEACGVSTRQVQRWADEARGRVAAINAEAERTAAEVLISGSKRAAERLLEVLETAEAPSDITRAALAVLDRTGHAATSKVEATGRDGGPQEHRVLVAGLESLSDEELARKAEEAARLLREGR